MRSEVVQTLMRFMRNFSLFTANRFAFSGFVFVMLVFVVAVSGNALRPDRSPNANQQNLSIARLKPMSKVQFLKIPKNKASHSNANENWSDVDLVPVEWIELQEKRVKVKIYSSRNVDEYHFYTYLDLFYPVSDSTIKAYAQSDVQPFPFVDLNGDKQELDLSDLANKVEQMTFQKTFYLGTDQFGRGVLSRLMAGSAVSLLVGLMSTLIALFFGFIIGSVSGYFGGFIDRFLGSIINIFWSIPAVMLVIILIMVIGNSLFALALGIGLILWVEMAQVIRAEVKQMREKDFILASKLMGLTNIRILFVHVLPNVSGPLMVLSISAFAEAILLEAGLSFMGVGVQPPKPSWGNMIRDAYGYIVTDGAHLAIIPGLALVLLVLSFIAISRGVKMVFELRSF
jgi:peptide/nickel transport system permease protein